LLTVPTGSSISASRSAKATPNEQTPAHNGFGVPRAFGVPRTAEDTPREEKIHEEQGKSAQAISAFPLFRRFVREDEGPGCPECPATLNTQTT
jgi:hypothetical protein